MKSDPVYCIIPSQLDLESEQYIINYIKRFYTSSLNLIFLEKADIIQQLNLVYRCYVTSIQELKNFFTNNNASKIVFFSNDELRNLLTTLKTTPNNIHLTEVLLPTILKTTTRLNSNLINKTIAPSRQVAENLNIHVYTLDSEEIPNSAVTFSTIKSLDFSVLFSRPKQNNKLCLFASFDTNNLISTYTIAYLEELRNNGFDIVFVSTSDSVEIDSIKALCRTIIHRPNIGIDFGSWHVGMHSCDINEYDSLLLANDNVFGPFSALSSIFKKFDSVSNNFCGLIDSYERRYHCQSYFLYFKKPLFSCEFFQNFWKREIPASKQAVIDNCEILLTQILVANKEIPFIYTSYLDLARSFSMEAIDSECSLISKIKWCIKNCIALNPSLVLWKFLHEKKSFPFIKKSLQRTSSNTTLVASLQSSKLFLTNPFTIKYLTSSEKTTTLSLANESNSHVNIHQIYYLPTQAQYLTKTESIAPYDNSTGISKLCEYGVFMDNFTKIQQSPTDYTGYISWKFTQKTKRSIKDFDSFIRSNPGYDLYAIQPFPIQFFPKGVWEQGSRHHPEILETISWAISQLNLDPNILHFTLDPSKLITCNYWVATKQFWQAYQNYTLPIAEFLIKQAELDPQLNHKLFVRTTDNSDTWGAIFPYIMERLVVSLLHQRLDFKTKIWHVANNIIL